MSSFLPWRGYALGYALQEHVLSLEACGHVLFLTLAGLCVARARSLPCSPQLFSRAHYHHATEPVVCAVLRHCMCYQSTMVPEYRSAMVPWYQGTRALGHQGTDRVMLHHGAAVVLCAVLSEAKRSIPYLGTARLTPWH